MTSSMMIQVPHERSIYSIVCMALLNRQIENRLLCESVSSLCAMRQPDASV